MKQITLLFTVIFSIVIFQNCKGQSRQYKSLPSEYKKKYTRTPVPESLRKKAVNIEKYLPSDYAENNNTDYTQNIQKALNENNVVLFPKGILSITGLSVQSNSILIFEEGSELRMIPNNWQRYQILSITGVKNIIIYNPKLTGDLKLRKSFEGEWGYGIDIRGAQNIKIYSPYISETFGDGIGISRSSKGVMDESIKLLDTSNILIEGAFIDHSGRNGISIIGVDGLVISSSIIMNTFTKKPQSAIDIEPDNSSYMINNIVINDIFTFNNVLGILFAISKQTSVNRSSQVNIQINNHTDVGASYPLNFPKFTNNKQLKPLTGAIEINNPVWIDNKHPFVRNESYGLSPDIVINNPVLKNLKLKEWKNKKLNSISSEETIKLHINDTKKIKIQYLN